MKIAALIFGILAGLSALPLATYAHAFVALGGGSDGSMLYLLPVAMFVGAGLALNAPAIGGGILLICALILLGIGGKFGYAINIVTIGPVVLSGIGGLLAVGAAATRTTTDLTVALAPGSGQVEPAIVPPAPTHHFAPVAQPGPTAPPAFDRAKWNALVKYDEDIGRLAGKIEQLGDKWVDVFAADYLALNDKSYLPGIVRRIIADAKAEEEAAEQARVRQQDAERDAAIRSEQAAAEENRRLWARNEERLQSRRKRVAFFWGTPQRSLLTNAVILVLIIGAGVAGWRAYATLTKTYAEPFAYCAAVGTRDAADISIDKQWTGPSSPETIKVKLNGYSRAFRWRCMDGAVYVCLHDKGDCFDRYSSTAPQIVDRQGYPQRLWSNFNEE
jgi:hypothetical protein